MTTPDLRPLSFGELLDRTFSLYRRHFWVFVGIMAIPQLFIVAWAMLWQSLQSFAPASRSGTSLVMGPGQMSGIMTGFFLGVLVMFAVYIVVYAVAQGATTFAVSETHLGRTATVRASYRSIRGRVWRLIDLVVSIFLRLIGLMILILAGVGGVVGTAAVGFSISGVGIALFGVALVLGIVLVVLIFLRYALTVPALMLEDIKARAAIKRSVMLTKGNLGRVFLIFLLTIIIVWAVALAIQGPFQIASVLLVAKKVEPPQWLHVLVNMSGGVAGAFTGPLMTIALALLYYDVRVRREGYDLQLMMEGLEETSAGVDQAKGIATMAAAQLEETSVWVIILLSIVSLGLYLPVWFLTRREAINQLRSRHKIGWGMLAFLLLLQIADVVALIVSARAGLSMEEPDVFAFGAWIVILIQSFKVRQILLDHFSAQESGPFSGTISLQRDVSLSGVATFFFHIFYLQYKINRFLEAPALSAA